MAAHGLLARVADRPLREAVGYDLGAPLPAAPPLLWRHTRGSCDWLNGICSVPDRVTWFATGTHRTASCGRSRRTKHGRVPVPELAPAPREKVSQHPEAPLTVVARGRRAYGLTPLWDEAVLKAPRNWLRKALIGLSGAKCPGSSPSCQCQEAICRNTEGSWATIEIGTWWLARSPLTVLEGWWSPSRMSTRFGSLSSVTHEVRARSEYCIDRP